MMSLGKSPILLLAGVLADQYPVDEEALEAVANGGSMDLYVWIRDYAMSWITRD
jgi:hypothetical protein